MAATNPYLTPAAYRMLKALRDGEGRYAIADGAAVCVDGNCFRRQTLDRLLRLCLLTLDTSDSSAEKWYLNEEGERILDDPDYAPRNVSAPQPSNSEVGALAWICAQCDYEGTPAEWDPKHCCPECGAPYEFPHSSTRLVGRNTSSASGSGLTDTGALLNRI